MTIELLKTKDQCCGCRACEHVCAFGAIEMVDDECGFAYPKIDGDRCTECGACVRKCAFQSGYPARKELEPSLGFGARHKDENVFMRSRSGAAFVALSDVVLARGGVVYGAGYADGSRFKKVCHKCATTAEARDEFCGSKYVQSDLGMVFPEIKELLKEDVAVLFSGTGCQVGALHKFLGREYDNLYTIDIVCHGVPSPKIWSDYLDLREREFKESVTHVDFRDKVKFGWKAHRETIWMGGGSHSSKLFTKFFQLAVGRPSCYSCVYCNKNRPGDVTIADFWGHEKALGDRWDDDRGISLVLVNTSQGKRLWEASLHDLDFVDCTGYPFRHTNMKRPTKKSERYDEFWGDYITHGFEFCAEKYAGYHAKPQRVISAPANSELKGKAEAAQGVFKRVGSLFGKRRRS